MDIEIDVIKKSTEAFAAVTASIGSVFKATRSIQALLKSPQTDREKDLKVLVVDLASQIADTKLANAELKEQMSNLTEALTQAKMTREKFAKYHLHELPCGDFVYKYCPADEDGTPEHFICPQCKENGKISPLKPRAQERYQCRPCKAYFGPDIDRPRWSDIVAR